MRGQRRVDGNGLKWIGSPIVLDARWISWHQLESAAFPRNAQPFRAKSDNRQTDKALIWPGEDGPSLPCYLLWAPENAINFPSYGESSGNGTELMDLSGIGLCSHSGNESYSVERSMCNTETARASLPPYHRLSNRPWKLDWTRVIISN